MSSIPLARPQPRRLFFDGEHWSLEILRWQPIDRDIFSPFNSFVLGTEALLRHIAELVDDPSVLSDTRSLVTRAATAGTSYEFTDGRWIGQPQSAAHPPSVVSLPDEGLALQARVKELERKLEALQARVAEIEDAAPARRGARVSSLPPAEPPFEEGTWDRNTG